MSPLTRFFTTPPTPANAAAFLDGEFTVVELRKQRHGVSLASSAVTQLPPGLVEPSFETDNIKDADELTSIIQQTVEIAGLSNKRRWSVALPEGVARSLVVGVESKPKNRRELSEVLAWKVERAVAVPAGELRISHQRIRPAAGEERYVVTVAVERVLSEYESFLKRVGWHAGLLLPRHMGECQWLLWDPSPDDKILVSASRSGFTSVVIQDGEPTLVRAHACEPEATFDELYRVAVYYKDRLAGDGADGGFGRVLVLGGIDAVQAQGVIAEATGRKPDSLDPAGFGIDLRGETVTFDQVAGAAGLALMAWQ